MSLPQGVYPGDSFDTVKARGTGGGVPTGHVISSVSGKSERCSAARKRGVARERD